MGDSKLYTKVKASDIQAELNTFKKHQRSTTYLKTILKKIIVLMTIGDNEVGILADDVIAILLSLGKTDKEVKDLCYLYLTSTWKHRPKQTVRALSFMVSDYRSGSEREAGLTMKSMATIQLPEFLKQTTLILEDALTSKSPHIRKTAAYCVAQIYKTNNVIDSKANAELITLLNQLLVDPEIDVIAAALNALADITSKSNTLKLSIDQEHAQKLSQGLSRCPEWCQVSILNCMLYYVPQTHKSAEDMVDTVLPYLQSQNSSIVLNALKVVVYFCNYVDKVLDVFPSLPQSISVAVTNLMLKPPEIQFLAMRNVILLLLDKPALLELDISMFFCQYDDLLYIKDTKLEIIFLLANEDNMDIVLAELQEYAMGIDVQMVRKSIRAIGNLAVKIDATSEKCVSILADLLSNAIPYVVEEIAIIVRDILRKYPGTFDYIIGLLVNCADLIKDPESKASLIWILGEYSSSISDSTDLLCKYASNFADDPIETQLTLLTAIVKAHICQPYNKKLHELVESTLTTVIDGVDNPDVRQRGLFYWRLLSAQLPNAIDIIKPRLPPLDTDTDALGSKTREELELCIGCMSSIYLRPISQVFRHCKPPTLIKSPAFTIQDLKTPRQAIILSRHSSQNRSRSSTLSSTSFRSKLRRTSQRLSNLTIDENSDTFSNSSSRPNSGSLDFRGFAKKLGI